MIKRCKSFIDLQGHFLDLFGALLQVIQLWASTWLPFHWAASHFWMALVPFRMRRGVAMQGDTKSDRVALMFFPLDLLYTLYVHWYGIAWGMVVDRQIYHWLTFGLMFQVGIISTDEGFQYAELRERLRLEPGHKYVLVSEMPGLGELKTVQPLSKTV